MVEIQKELESDRLKFTDKEMQVEEDPFLKATTIVAFITLKELLGFGIIQKTTTNRPKSELKLKEDPIK
ncbi:unnamed protein product [Dovyalis caffra]|uniref:Uncharacterized protein n=1 Tax=Dovyalis caffra TaxID=77055 RepID=A0AAV1QPR3_9ROSI|nr:unnamed protein product [Dovyalis caffra]